MNILLISSFLPYPLYSGGHVRLYNLVKRLSEHHTITLVCEKRPYQTSRDIAEVKKICEEVITVPRRKQWSITNILKTGFSHDPFLIAGHTSAEMRRKVERLLKEKKFDCIHVETFYVSQNLPDTKLPVILIEHNIEYSLYQRFVDKAPVFARPLLSLDVKKLKKIEEKYWKTADCVVAVSDQEKEIIAKYNTHVAIVPNGVDIHQFKLKNIASAVDTKKEKILFIGDFSYIQNRDAATFIIKEIAPLLRGNLKGVDFQIWIKARKIPQSIKDLSHSQDIIYDENMDTSTADIFTQAHILLAPIRMGAGTQYKILESMSCGTPVVTTMLGNEGVNAKPGKEILTGETASQIAVEVRKVLEDDILYETIAKNARLLIEKNFRWEIITKKLETVYEDVVRKK